MFYLCKAQIMGTESVTQVPQNRFGKQFMFRLCVFFFFFLMDLELSHPKLADLYE